MCILCYAFAMHYEVKVFPKYRSIRCRPFGIERVQTPAAADQMAFNILKHGYPIRRSGGSVTFIPPHRIYEVTVEPVTGAPPPPPNTVIRKGG
jgi:hypothetical protein